MDNGHLSETDLEIVWNSKSSRSEGQAEQRLLAHCRECAPCAEMLNDFEEVHREIDSLKDLGNTYETACPSVDLWIRMAAGLMSEQQAMQMLKHASACRQCSQQLVRAQSYVSDHQEPLAGLESGTVKWQKAVARQMAAHSIAPKQSGLRVRWFWIPATATAMVCAALAAWLSGVGRSPDVNDLLAKAYSQNRTLEPRFSGAKYGPLRTERSGNGQSMLNQSAALLEALPLISRHLEKEPNNPLWLDAKGRADLLGRNYSSAIQSFEKALEADPDSPLLLTDAASAYFERGQIADRPGDYGRTIELLSQALKKNPDDPIALYNRALVNEKMFLFHQAMEDWTHYLRVAPTGEWADEATQHLNAVRKKLAEQQARASEPLLDPDALLRETAGQDEKAGAILDRRPDEYLDRAIRKWLPIAFAKTASLTEPPTYGDRLQNVSFSNSLSSIPQSFLAQSGAGSNAPPAAAPARFALHVLTDVLQKKHGDEWLSGLLESPPSFLTAPAIQALAEAVNANTTGDFELARHKSNQAAALFRRAGNVAGELRAQYELVYALERSKLGKRCLVEALPLASRLAAHRYSWIQVQLEVLQANCWALLGQFDEAATSLKQSLAGALRSEYGALYLRALGIVASLLTAEGSSSAACSISLKGLALYWSGSYPPMRAQQFYSNIWFPVHKAGQWNFALALEKEAVSAIALTEQRLGEAVTRQRLANAASMVGDYDLATAESDRAKQLFDGLPPSMATRTSQAAEEIEQAKLEAGRGEASGSSMHLLQARKQLPQIVDYFIAVHFYQALGALQQLKGQRKETEKAFLSAVAASEWGLASSQTERERITWAREAGDAYRSLAEIYWKSGDVAGALRIWEWYRGASVRGSRGDAPQQNVAQARLKSSDVDFARLESGPPLPYMAGLLREPIDLHGSTLLSYMQLSTGLVVWVFDDRGIDAKWIAVAPSQISRLTRHFRDECADPKSDLVALRQDARRLYDLLIAPVSGRLLPERALVIEPDDAVAELPVSALLDPAGRYLGEVYPLVFSPGLLYQRHLRSVQGLTPHRRALALGSPALGGDLGASLGPLDDSASEARYVASKFEKATVFTGAQASLSNVRRELPRAAVFHFAGHAIANGEELGLMLASPDSLDTRARTASLLNISNLPTIDLRKLQLAVLSACSTATGDEDEPRDPENLVRVFLRAGVPQVVASRWNVNSAATAQFMHIFYDHLLREHASVPTALQAAGVALRQAADTAHPYYWAAFSAFGRG